MHPGLGQGVGLGLKMTAPPPSSAPAPQAPSNPLRALQLPHRSTPSSWSTKSPSLLLQQFDSSRPWTPDDNSILGAPFEPAFHTNKTETASAAAAAAAVASPNRQPSYQLPRWTGFQNFHLDSPIADTFLDSATNSSVVHLSAGTTFFFSARTSVASDCRTSSVATLTALDHARTNTHRYHSIPHDSEDEAETGDEDGDGDDASSEASSVADLDLDLDIDPDIIRLLTSEESGMTAAARADRHMAVSVRPKTAKDYQRYRSQWSGDAANMSTTAAILARSGQNGLSEFYAPNIGKKRASPSVSRKTSMSRTTSFSRAAGSERRKMEKTNHHVAAEQRGPSTPSNVPNTPNTPKKVYAAPASSSPSLMTRQEFDALPPAIQRKVRLLSWLLAFFLFHAIRDVVGEKSQKPDSKATFPFRECIPSRLGLVHSAPEPTHCLRRAGGEKDTPAKRPSLDNILHGPNPAFRLWFEEMTSITIKRPLQLAADGRADSGRLHGRASEADSPDVDPTTPKNPHRRDDGYWTMAR
jgi:hypothetical protein